MSQAFDGVSPAVDLLIAEILQFARRVDRLAATVLTRQRVARSDDDRLLLYVLAFRMYRDFQAVNRLANCGLREPAASVLRVLHEQGYVFSALHADPLAAQKLAKQGAGEARKAFQSLRQLDLGSRPPDLTNEVLDEAVAQLSETQSWFDAQFWASKAGMLDSYRTIYRNLARHSHGSINALDDYVRLDNEGEAVAIGDSIVRFSIPAYLVTAASLILDAAHVVAGWNTSDERMEAEFTSLHGELLALSERSHKALESSHREDLSKDSA